jgi:DNA-binding beta-propeller fold protein YncE
VSRWEISLAALVLLAALAGVRISNTTRKPSVQARFAQGGVAVDLEVDPVADERRGQPLRAGDEVAFRFRITDAATGAPFGKGYPVAWVDRRRADEAGGDDGCRAKMRGFLEGSLFRRADIDLNEYQVLVLNDDATISVVDPRFGFGGTKLLSLVSLRSAGADWALTGDQSALFVSMPRSARVAVVNPVTWMVDREIEAGVRPGRMALQPDEGYLWVLDEGTGTAPLATVISPRGRRVVARIGAGGGASAIAFSDDSRTAFITRPGAGKVAVVDIPSLTVVREIAAGRAPGAVAWSALSRAAYVADAEDGGVTVIDGERREAAARIAAGPRLSGIRFAPGGRLGVAWSAELDRLAILDASSNQVVQSATISGGPDQVTFSDTLAYVRQRASETVLVIPVDRAGATGEGTPAGEFPGGQAAPGRASLPDSIVVAPGGGAVLVANAADRAVYYYKEGMAAPMGHFSTYGRTPRGVLVLDRSLRERSPGIHETVARLPSPGKYDVAFLLDAPRMVHCFTIDVAEDSVPRAGDRLVPELADPSLTLTAGRSSQVRIRLRDAATGEPWDEPGGVEVLAYLSPGIWQTRGRAEPDRDGVYTLDLTPPQAGVYSIVVMSPPPGATLQTGAPMTLAALAAEPPAR